MKMHFSIKAFIKFRIPFTKSFIMPLLEINHLVIFSSVIHGSIGLPPIELTVGKLFCRDSLAFTFPVVLYVLWDEEMDGFKDGRTSKDAQASDIGN